MRHVWKSASWRVAGIRWTSSTATSALQVTLEPLDDTIFTLTMNRPEAKNAISRQFLRELKGWIANLNFERSARCVILRSAVTQVFCAGADLKVQQCVVRYCPCRTTHSFNGTYFNIKSAHRSGQPCQNRRHRRRSRIYVKLLQHWRRCPFPS